MLSRLVGVSLEHRWLVALGAVVLVVTGLRAATTAPLDVFPDFAPPQVSIQTEAPGLPPDQVEQLVTRPLEGALLGLGQLGAMRSESSQGLSVIVLTFADDADAYRTRQVVSEALGQVARDLPSTVHAPTLSPLTSATMDLLSVGFTSAALDGLALRRAVDTAVRPRFAAVQGVAATVEFGGDVTELQIQVKPDRLSAYGVPLSAVVDAARRASTLPGGGVVETAGQRITLSPDASGLTPAALAAAPVPTATGTVPIGELADVLLAPAPKFGDALIDGEPGVILKTLSQYGANTLETTRRLEAELEALRPGLEAQGITVHAGLFRPATFIETAIHNITDSLEIGAVLVAVVLVLFLMDLRTAFISLTAIPLSLLAAVLVLTAGGATLNTLTLGGLVIAIGEVVDDAIIDVENIHRRLGENAASAAPRSALAVVLAASLEVRSSVVYATLIVCLVFLPVLGLGGLEGRLFSPLANAYILAVGASLAVALTVTPALSLLLLRRASGRHREPLLGRVLRRAYVAALRPLQRYAMAAGVAALLLCAAAAGLTRGFGATFLPEFREGHFVLHVDGAPGTGLGESLRVGRRLTQAMAAAPHVVSTPEQVGRAERGEDPWGPNRTEWHVNLDAHNAAEEEEARAGLAAALARFPGQRAEITTFLGDRIGETLSGETAPVVVNVFGDDLDALDSVAGEVARRLARVPGATGVAVAAPVGTPGFSVAPRPSDLAALRVPAGDVLETVETALDGATVGQVPSGLLPIPVVVSLIPSARRDPDQLRALPVGLPAGGTVPLGVLADVGPTTGRATIRHDAGLRRQTVTCGVTGRDVSSFVADAQRVVAGAGPLPKGVSLSWSGAAEAAEAARNTLLMHTGLAALGVLVLLALALRGARNLGLVLLNLPFALVGGVVAVALTSGTLSLGTLVGMVTLFGITTRNAIMLVSHYEHLVLVEGHPWDAETALRGASERLVPILMTALVTAIGLLPIALGAGEPGREIEGEMAIVILGGLVTSTLLTLGVLPLLAPHLAAFRRVAPA